MYDVYQVKFSDTLETIANNFGISSNELMSINNINGNLKYGDYIVVPSNNTNLVNYIVEKGDTLYSIAQKHNIPVDVIVNINGMINDDYIYPGEILMIPKPKINTYIVKEGDTLSDIVAKSDLNDIITQNTRIYLLPNQLIVYTKE